MSHKIPGRLWESLGAAIIAIYNKHYLCIVDYHRKFPIVKQVEGFSKDDLIKKCKTIFLRVHAAQQNSFRCRHKHHIR